MMDDIKHIEICERHVSTRKYLEQNIAELVTRIAKAELAFAIVEGRNAELEKERDKYKAYYELGRRTEIREAPRG